MARIETTVLSAALCDPEAISQLGAPLVRAMGLVPRPVDPDFAATVEAGYVETPDEFAARLAARRMQAALVTADGDDVQTTRADLRAAVCLARGVAIDDVCPSKGYDLSDRAFTAVRDSWAELLGAHRPSDWTYARHDEARAFWANARPDLIHDWPEVER